MTDSLTINEDSRRKLTSFPEGKMLEIKEDCVVGGHYHKIKTEWFVLSTGMARIVLNGTAYDMGIGELWQVPPDTQHEFHITAGSILIGLCSHPYDETD